MYGRPRLLQQPNTLSQRQTNEPFSWYTIKDPHAPTRFAPAGSGQTMGLGATPMDPFWNWPGNSDDVPERGSSNGKVTLFHVSATIVPSGKRRRMSRWRLGLEPQPTGPRINDSRRGHCMSNRANNNDQCDGAPYGCSLRPFQHFVLHHGNDLELAFRRRQQPS